LHVELGRVVDVVGALSRSPLVAKGREADAERGIGAGA
jgi:hypothetical protein